MPDKEYFPDKPGSIDWLLLRAFMAGVNHGRDHTPLSAIEVFMRFRRRLTNGN